jgi:hypothetical protein
LTRALIATLVSLVICSALWAVDEPMGVERVARLYSPIYRSKLAKSDAEVRWVQIDLGRSYTIDAVKLLPAVALWGDVASEGFPSRFKIEVSDDPAFKTAVLTTARLAADYPNPKDAVAICPAGGAQGRYVRLTAMLTAVSVTVVAPELL